MQFDVSFFLYIHILIARTGTLGVISFIKELKLPSTDSFLDQFSSWPIRTRKLSMHPAMGEPSHYLV